MKNHLYLLGILCLFIWTTGCGGAADDHDHEGEHDHGTEIPDPILPGEPGTNALESKSLETKNCEGDSGCAEVQAKYPLAVGYPAAVNDSINTFVNKTAIGQLGYVSDKEINSIATVAQAFVDAYVEEITGLDGETPPGWEANMSYSVPLQSSKALCLAIDCYSFSGGAHGNGSSNYRTFDLATGKEIQLHTLIQDKKGFMAVAEKLFREEQGIAANASFMDEGFTFERLPLPTNMGVSGEAVILHYNPYEIAPYAFGPSTINIPRSDLGGLFDFSKLE